MPSPPVVMTSRSTQRKRPANFFCLLDTNSFGVTVN